MADKKRSKADLELDLASIVAGEIGAATHLDDSDASQQRSNEIDYYNGYMPDLVAPSGKSQVVSRDTSDVIGWMQPGIARLFLSSDRMAMFEETKPEQADHADHVTISANHTFLKDNPGYEILNEATFDALLHGDGFVKAFWDDTPETEVSEHTGLSEDQLSYLLQDENVEVLAQETEEQQIETPEGIMSIPVFSVKIQRTITSGKIVVECMEPENFLINRDANTIREARFTAHRCEKTRSQLIEMGFKRSDVEELPTWSTNDFTDEQIARNTSDWQHANIGDDSTNTVELYECYIQADVDNDGVSETCQIFYAGHGAAGNILDWQVWEDANPFHKIPCNPLPHKFESQSITDLTMDVQQIKTQLQRGGLDNTYETNRPMKEVELGSVLNPDILTTPVFGGIIQKKKGSPPIIPHVIPYTADKSFAAIQYFDSVIEMRTGVSRSTMALDPEALQNQTATASNNAKDSAYSKIELVARNMAEGWRQVFETIHELTVKHQDRSRQIKLRDKWIELNPKSWEGKFNVTINVGLGTGTRERDMILLQQVLQNQNMAMERLHVAGLSQKAMEYIPLIRDTMVKIAESAGFQNADTFYPEFDDQAMQEAMQVLEQQKSQPDPVMMQEQAKAQAQIQIEQVKAQSAQQLKQMELQAQTQADQVRAGIEREDKVAQIQVQRDKEQAQLEADITLERERTKNDTLKHADQLILDREKLESTERIALEKLKLEELKLMQTAELEREKIKASLHKKTIMRDESGRAIGIQ
ncbi:MAG: hypothetical protein GY779_03305 [Gammaproteobacteria bacterium]|nr:hypothetical protein [Gammaproteobacteria bacterium]